MNRNRGPRTAVALAAATILTAGCTSLREIPRTEYAAEAERRNVRLETRDGLTYEFDFVNVNGDSLMGYRRREVSGPVEEFAVLAIPLEDVMRLSRRSVDWYRTGLIGGGVLAAIVAKGLSEAPNGSAASEGGGARPGGRATP